MARVSILHCLHRPATGVAVLGAVLAVLIGAPPTSARAPASRSGVEIGARQIVVTAPSGARAIVTRHPFGLAIVNAAGRTVLEEVGRPARPAPPTPVAASPQSEFGTIGPPPPTRYAPLSFLVGTQRVTQTASGQWEGTLRSVTESGVKYSARSVINVHRRGDVPILARRGFPRFRGTPQQPG